MNPPTPPSCRGLVLLARMTGGSGDFAVERFFTFDPPRGSCCCWCWKRQRPFQSLPHKAARRQSAFPTRRPSAKVPFPQGGRAPKCLPRKAAKRQSAFPTRRPSVKVHSTQPSGPPCLTTPPEQVWGGSPPLGVLGSSTGGYLEPPYPPCCRGLVLLLKRIFSAGGSKRLDPPARIPVLLAGGWSFRECRGLFVFVKLRQ